MALIVAVVNQSNAAAVSLADAGLSVQIEHATGIPTPVTGIAPTDHAERLQKAVSTILDDDSPIPNCPTGYGDADRTARPIRTPRGIAERHHRRNAAPTPRRGMDKGDGRRPLPTVPVVVARGSHLAQGAPVPVP